MPPLYTEIGIHQSLFGPITLQCRQVYKPTIQFGFSIDISGKDIFHVRFVQSIINKIQPLIYHQRLVCKKSVV